MRGGRMAMGRTFGGEDLGFREELLPPPTPNSQRSNAEGPRCFVGVCSFQNQGKNGENQDSFIATENGTKSLVAVLDGHGEQGKRVSEYARIQLAKNLYASKELYSKPTMAMEHAFAETQKGIERSHAVDAHRSGTTAVACYRHRDRLVVANVGDSRAVLGRCPSRETGDARGLRAVDLSSDQRPMREDERSRILQQGGSVHQSAIPMRQGFGPPVLVRVGPERVWDKTGRCGLCVTRSLGDLSMHPFVIAQPEVSERILCSKDRVLILGSDGVWDRINSQEAVDIAAKHSDPNAAAREIASVARQRWHVETQGQLADDITAVVMHLDHTAHGVPHVHVPHVPHAAHASAHANHAAASHADGLGRASRPSSKHRTLLPDANLPRPGLETAPVKLRSRRLEPLRSSRAERLGLVHLPVAAGLPSRRR